MAIIFCCWKPQCLSAIILWFMVSVFIITTCTFDSSSTSKMVQAAKSKGLKSRFKFMKPIKIKMKKDKKDKSKSKKDKAKKAEELPLPKPKKLKAEIGKMEEIYLPKGYKIYPTYKVYTDFPTTTTTPYPNYYQTEYILEDESKLKSMQKTASKYSNKYQPFPYPILPYKKVKHHHYHPVVLYKKKKIPGKFWHEAQRRLVTKHGGLDVLGDIVQLPSGRVLSDGLGQNVPNLNDGYWKPYELQRRIRKMQRDLVKALMKRLVELIKEGPAIPEKGLFLVKEIGILE